MRKLVLLLFVLVLAGAGVYVVAGRAAGPAILIPQPEKAFIGASTPIEVVVGGPGVRPSSISVFFEQNGTRTLLYQFTQNPVLAGGAGEGVTDDGTGTIRWKISKLSVPKLVSGPARLIVTASRKVLGGIRHADSTLSRDVKVRLEHPRVSVESIHHYINHGGAEMVVYRVAPADVTSGVVVGDIEYPGYPVSGARVPGAKLTDPALRVAFFALRYDQDLHAPMRVFARDETGEVAYGEFDNRTFAKPFKHSMITLEDKFLDRVVPAILAGTTEVTPAGSTIDKFLAINGDLRRKNNAKIASFAAQTSPEMFWGGVVFHPFTNTKVEAAFADFRTYLYKGREIDKQVHLGFDLASFAHASVVAANRGKVLYAADLGIYGTCVIIDHGMGVQSLYAHLSSVGVQPGAMVEKDQEIGKSGVTGLVQGDHLHFTMLVNGQMVNPIEWWDPHWIQDRILRKLK